MDSQVPTGCLMKGLNAIQSKLLLSFLGITQLSRLMQDQHCVMSEMIFYQCVCEWRVTKFTPHVP